MTKKYIAIGSVGETLPGGEVKGLDDNRIQALLASGAIEEYQEPQEPKADGAAARLAELEKANTDLLTANKLMTDEKVKSDQENGELKAKVAELEKANTDLLTANKLMTDEKVKSDQENGELKAKVAELEKALAASETALKKATAEAKKAASEAK
ncbi:MULTISPECIES: hypothetical protein [unclassified Acinetobacter]|uniref:hypothetical protein n=1 Tax=unclassified Acinetobacter TaxID=196816 RepID=UPI0015D3DEFC